MDVFIWSLTSSNFLTMFLGFTCRVEATSARNVKARNGEAPRVVSTRRRAHREIERTLDRLEPFVLIERLGVGGEADADPVHQVLAKLILLGVEGGEEQRAARVAHGEALALNSDPARRERF